jgi:hypothetical protein
MNKQKTSNKQQEQSKGTPKKGTHTTLSNKEHAHMNKHKGTNKQQATKRNKQKAPAKKGTHKQPATVPQLTSKRNKQT